jgi:predicted dehydrogenase
VSAPATSSVGVGVLGCGMICDEYFPGMRQFEVLDVLACADLDGERARAAADRHEVPRVLTPEELVADPGIGIVVNLTPPQAHAPVSMQAIAAGKSVWSEKPLALEVDEASATVAAAHERGVRLGCAPDTFLGGAWQTMRKLIDDGAIGKPVAATTVFATPGPERWVERTEAYYLQGGGPLLDAAPYNITALISLFGPAVRVSGLTSAPGVEHRKQLGPEAGAPLTIEVDTHATGIIEFANGVVATLVASWEIEGATHPYLEVYGSGGSLTGPDPDYHSGGPRGALRMLRPGVWDEWGGPLDEHWEPVELTHDASMLRGVGVADMASALLSDRPHRASGELALHALEIMRSIERSSREGAHVVLQTTCERPEPLPAGLASGQLD